MIYVGDGASVECGLDDPRCQTIDIGMVARMNEDRLGYVNPDYAEEQWSKTLATARLFSEAPNLLAELKRCYEVIDSLQHEMYGFKEALWAEALCDESENVVGVEAYPGDQKREKKVFFISCDLVDEMYVFFQQHGRLDLSKNASQ